MDETVINDISDDRVGRVVKSPLCNLYFYSPKADENRLIEFLDFAKNEPDSTDDIQEMADNMHLSELDETAEWLSGALSAVLKARAEKRKYAVQT
jgi:hypothetical protein